jgi:hypothetical protein
MSRFTSDSHFFGTLTVDTITSGMPDEICRIFSKLSASPGPLFPRLTRSTSGTPASRNFRSRRGASTSWRPTSASIRTCFPSVFAIAGLAPTITESPTISIGIPFRGGSATVVVVLVACVVAVAIAAVSWVSVVLEAREFDAVGFLGLLDSRGASVRSGPMIP